MAARPTVSLAHSDLVSRSSRELLYFATNRLLISIFLRAFIVLLLFSGVCLNAGVSNIRLVLCGLEFIIGAFASPG